MANNHYPAIKEQSKGLVIEKGKKSEPETANHPSNLIQQLQNQEEINEILIGPKHEYKIEFTKRESVACFKEYVFSPKALWYWLTILLATTSAIAIFVIPENAVPLVYLRSGFGVIFTLFLPGFVFIKTLFPAKMSFQTSSESMDTLERVALSLGMSLILTSMVGLILNYTPWGVRLTSITLSLMALTVVLATTAVFRELKQDNQKQNGEVAVNR